MKLEGKKTAIVHDFLGNYGGAEGVLESICEIFPEAPIFTLVYESENVNKWEKNWIESKKIEESFLKKAPNFLRKRKKYLLPFMPTAVEAFNLREYDLVISSCGAFSKGIVVKPKTIHICYMHSPMRYVWDWDKEYLENQKLRGRRKLLTRMFLSYLRTWDRSSADRPDYLVANSQYTAKRISKYYRRDSQIIYPPVEVGDFKPQKENGGYFLSVGRLSGYKRFNLIIDAFSKLKLPLVIAGQGEEMAILREKVKNCKGCRIKLAGWQRRSDLVKLYQNCRAFVFAAEDDFGIAPVEAMAAGKPVIALKAGGAAETIIEGKTGEFFSEPKMELLADGIRKFIENEKNYNLEEIRKQAEKFDKRRFMEEMKNHISNCLKNTDLRK